MTGRLLRDASTAVVVDPRQLAFDDLATRVRRPATSRADKFAEWEREAFLTMDAPPEVERWLRRYIQLHDRYMAATHTQGEDASND